MNVNFPRVGVRVKMHLFGDYYKLVASQSKLTSCLVREYGVANDGDTFFAVRLLAHSRKQREHAHYIVHATTLRNKDSMVGLGPWVT